MGSLLRFPYSASHLPPPEPVDAQAALADTEAFWREWSSRCVDVGEWTPAVRRSLITLKALTYRPTGGIVAAPTTSLPEQLGGSRCGLPPADCMVSPASGG
jgi:GH15 family glucan-1,4-alpha-glucosidase